MLRRQGFTLMEMLIVLIIIGICASLFLANFNMPTEQARALNAQNNLMAIYSAQRNYYNNYGHYVQGNLMRMNSALSLNIQNDGTYLYSCQPNPVTYCYARRWIGQASPLEMTLTFNQPIQLNPGQLNQNPSCSAPANPGWCP